MRAPRSLRARVAAAAVAALAASLLVAGALLVSAIGREGRETVDRELERRAALLHGVRGPVGVDARGGPPDGGGGPPEPGRGPRGAGRGAPGLLAGSGTFVRLIVDGEVVEQRGDEPAEAAPVPARPGFGTVELDGDAWRYLLVAPLGRPDVRIQLFQSLAPVEERMDATRELVLGFGLLALALTALGAWWATSLALRPLGRLRAAAAEVSGTEDLRRRLPQERSDPAEVATLTRSLNEMLERLEGSAAATDRALRATRRFAADAGHELRTPMTGLRANLEALLRNPDLPLEERRGALEEMRGEQNRMVALLEGLQALARGEASGAVPREPVELGDVVDAAVEAARRRHPGVTFELEDASGDGVVEGWPDGLRMLFDNLLDNAAVHGRPEGHVVVRVRPDRPAALLIEVEDDGPGLPPEERARVLEPFARGTGASAPGSGLGLAVVAQQAAIHGGEVRLDDADAGGLRAGVRLPLAAA